MTRRRASVTQNDLSRIVRATAAIVGLERIAGVRVSPTGEVLVEVGERSVTISPPPVQGGANEWDEVLIP